MNYVYNIIISFVCGIAGAMAVTVMHSRLYDRPIATVSVNQLITEHLDSVASNGELDDAAINVMSANYASTIQDTIRSISTDQQVTLLVKPAVLTDAPDYTDVVRQALGQDDTHDQ